MTFEGVIIISLNDFYSFSNIKNQKLQKNNLDTKARYDCNLKTTPSKLFHPLQEFCRIKLTSGIDRAEKITIDMGLYSSRKNRVSKNGRFGTNGLNF